MNRYRVIALAAIIIIVAIAACVFLVVSLSQPAPLAGTSWRLVAVDGRAVTGNQEYIINFGSGKFTGRTPSNAIDGDYLNAGNNFRVTSFHTTLMGGIPLETTFQNGLNGARKATINNGHLMLSGSHDLEFEPIKTP